jgi:hypothetical protein
LTSGRQPTGVRLLAGVGQVAIAYGVGVLASLLFVAWVFAILLFDSWGVSAWVATAIVVVAGVAAATAIAWRVARTAGLIRVAVMLALGVVWVIVRHVGGDSPEMFYATGAAYLLGVALLPNLVVKRYERHRSRLAHP